MPNVLSAKPTSTRSLARRFPLRFPASRATPNMLNESGASERPAFIASYSSVICRKIGSVIIAPPSVICCSICWVIPMRKCGNRNRSGSSNVTLPSRWRVTSHQASDPSATAPSAMSTSDELAALLPHQDAEDDATHPDHRKDGAHDVDLARPRVLDVADHLDARQHHCDHDHLEREADPPRQVGRHETAEERPDRGRDRGRRRRRARTPASEHPPRSCRGSATASPAAAATRRARR